MRRCLRRTLAALPTLMVLGGAAFLLLPATGARAQRGTASTTDSLLHCPLAPGQAVVWYLYHSGWAVRTAEHFLVFDYIESGRPEGVRTFENGWIEPDRIAHLAVTVFVSHDHGDHFDGSVLRWERALPAITYIFGFPIAARPRASRFGVEREHRVIGGIEVWNIHHEADGIPESAFLVRCDGVTLFHAGDHGNSATTPMRPDFRDNITYLSGLGHPVDLCFLPIWGYTEWQVAMLQARTLLPMHEGGREARLAADAEALRQAGLTLPILVPARPGDVFRYPIPPLGP
jgi:L-ascorbate metabolism protein UlaG (beta-lactamase superfamily)